MQLNEFLITCKNRTFSFDTAKTEVHLQKNLKMQMFLKVPLEENAELVPGQHLLTTIKYSANLVLILMTGKGFSSLLASCHTSRPYLLTT